MRLQKIKWHIIIWIIYLVYYLLLDYIAYNSSFNFVRELVIFPIQVWIFYSFLYSICNGSFKSIKKFFFTVLLFGISFLVLIFLNQIRAVVAKYYGVNLFETKLELIIDSVVFYTQFAIYSLGFYFFNLLLVKQKETKLLLEKNLTLQKSLLQSENDFLRAQINPHFLYNSLNYFYAETFEALPKVGDSIMALSDIMRYSLTDFTNTNGLANLNEEIQNIQNIIGINKSRVNDILYVQLIVHGNVEGKKITPMMFITLVENLFKHGDLQNANCPAFITCTVDENAKQVIFITSNKKSGVKNIIPGGLGTSNIKKRLELLYKDGFTLNFEEEIALYKATLVIPYFVS
jgi:two-component system, LytTR family, sensor kinase